MAGQDRVDAELKAAIAISVLQSQVSDGQSETKRRLERIEKKIDEQSSVPHSTFDAYRTEAANSFVTKTELEPIKKIVYGLVGLILTGVVIALISLVIRGAGS